MIPSIPSLQEAVHMLATMDKATLISMAYACYLYILMDAGNGRLRARRRRGY